MTSTSSATCLLPAAPSGALSPASREELQRRVGQRHPFAIGPLTMATLCSGVETALPWQSPEVGGALMVCPTACPMSAGLKYLWVGTLGFQSLDLMMVGGMGALLFSVLSGPQRLSGFRMSLFTYGLRGGWCDLSRVPGWVAAWGSGWIGSCCSLCLPQEPHNDPWRHYKQTGPGGFREPRATPPIELFLGGAQGDIADL